ncbi:MAG: DUF4429 domain-containing protein [Solobacterium sp.]|nr:DUF4429 domain-containing protein [Solobacterium sp.]
MEYKFRAKNGTVYLNHSHQVYIRRAGWFDTPYQWVTRGPQYFKVNEIEEVILKEPDMMRGYLDFKLKDGRKARVWLTRPGYVPMAEKMKQLVERQMKK